MTWYVGGRHPAPGRHGHRHRALGALPHPRGPAPGGREPPPGRDRQPGRDRRRRQPDRGRPAAPGVARRWSRSSSPRGGSTARPRPRAPALQHRGPRRLDRQRHVRHRHHDRGRHRAPPHHRGDRRDRLHRGQPPAHVRGRGDGPPLRLPGPHGRDRHRRELGAHPGEPARRGRLGGDDVRAPPHRPRGGAPRLHRHRGRGRARPPRQARSPPSTSAGSLQERLGEDVRDHDPRPRPAGRRPERLRPLHEHAARPRRGRGAPLLAARRRAPAHRDEGQPGHPPAPHGVRRARRARWPSA